MAALTANANTTDIYCYNCDDARIDPGLPNHLQTFGISVQGQAKTEKSMTELVRDHWYCVH
jgi:ubiquitin carboxyl-terminal hydrolase 5/13